MLIRMSPKVYIFALIIAAFIAFSSEQAISVRNKGRRNERSKGEIARSAPKNDHNEPHPYVNKFKAMIDSKRTVGIEKTAFNQSMRLMFLAGLEGVGHHALLDAFNVCRQEKLCMSTPAMSLHLNRFVVDQKNQTHLFGLFGSSDVFWYDNVFETLIGDFKTLGNVIDNKLAILAMEMVQGAGMLSYPNFEQWRSKSLDHPDLFTLAFMAEQTGVDFRVIVLLRDAKDILESDLRRHLGWELEGRILIDNAAVLHNQLLSIDKKFFTCIEYEKMGHFSTKEKDSLRNFIHPVIDAPLFDKMMSKVRPYNASEVKTYEHSEKLGQYTAARLQAVINMLRNVCGLDA